VKSECVLTFLSGPRCWRGLSCEVRKFAAEFMFHNASILAIKMNVSLVSINRKTFVLTTHCVYCEVQINLYILFRRKL
jgi:hypothetical protein